jgi:hypothetical protein
MGYIMVLFMRPIALPAPVRVIIRLVGAGGYRMFMASRVIGAILITLGVIGLAGAMVIRPYQNFNKFMGPDVPGQVSGGQVSQINKNNSEATIKGVFHGAQSYSGD